MAPILSKYKKLRNKIIQRNSEVLQELRLPELATEAFKNQPIGGESQTWNCSLELRVPYKSAALVSLVGQLRSLRTEACGFKLAYKCHRSTNPKQLQRRSPSHHGSKRV